MDVQVRSVICSGDDTLELLKSVCETEEPTGPNLLMGRAGFWSVPVYVDRMHPARPPFTVELIYSDGSRRVIPIKKGGES